MKIYYEESVMYQQEAYGVRKLPTELVPEWRKKEIRESVAKYLESKYGKDK